MNNQTLVPYLVDCVGYSHQDLEGLSNQELLDMVEDKNELEDFIG